MKLICTKDAIYEKVNMVQKAVPQKSTIPMLEGILLKADSNLVMTASSAEIGIECSVKADVLQKGSVIVNAKIFSDIIRKLPDAEFVLEVTDNAVKIDSENSSFRITGIPPEGYPKLQFPESEESFSVAHKKFCDIIKNTTFAASVDENKPILTGVLLETFNDVLTAVAVDGCRLALRRCKCQQSCPDMKMIVHSKTLSEIARMPQDSSQSINIYAKDNKAFFEVKDSKIVSRLLEGEYLKYGNVIPDTFDTKITVQTQQFLLSMERVALVSEDDKKHPVIINIANNKMEISCNTSIGSAREELVVDKLGKDIEIGFNPKYFIDAVKAIDDESIEMSFSSEVGPCVINPIEGDEYVYMMLPVRIG